MKRLAWFSAGLAAFFSASITFAQVGAPVAGAAGPPSGSYTSAQRVAAAQALAGGTILCKSFVQVTTAADTTEDTVYTCTLPALLPNAAVHVYTYWTITNGASTKTMRLRYSGAAGTIFGTIATTTNAVIQLRGHLLNRNSTSSQFTAEERYIGTSTFQSSNSTAAVDSSVAGTSVVATCQKVTAGDTCTLEGIEVILDTDGT